MKLRNKILAFAAPATAIAATMPIALTSCGVTYELATIDRGKSSEGAEYFYVPSTENVSTKDTFIFKNISAPISNSKRIVVVAIPKDEDKTLKPSSVKANGKTLTITPKTTTAGKTTYVCDSTDVLPTSDFNLEVKFAEEGKEVSFAIYVGPIYS